MSLIYNKRLKYFSSEAEYNAFVDELRAEAAAGTLDLYETLVCCITHGDPTTPDEYHPSTEPGYTDVTFEYNSEDNIHYVPFVNPMWTEKNILISPVTGGYEPKFQNVNPGNTHLLPDVVDGAQFTEITQNFTAYISTWPKFLVTNIKSLYYRLSSSYNNLRLNLPSSWPSLETMNICVTDRRPTNQNYPVFGDDNEVVAPNLTSVLYTIGGTGFTTDYPSDLTYVPKLYAPLQSFQIELGQERIGGQDFSADLDFDDVIMDSSHLTSLYAHVMSASRTLSYKLWRMSLTHTGASLNIPEVDLAYSDPITKEVHFNITSSNTITGSSLRLICDFHTSSFATTFSPSSWVRLYDCTSTAASTETICSYITHDSSSLSLNFPSPIAYELRGCNSFSDIEVIFPSTSTSNYFVVSEAEVSGQTLTIDVSGRTSFNNTNLFNFYGKYGAYTEVPEYVYDELIIKLPSSRINYTSGNVTSSMLLNIPANKLSIEGELWLIGNGTPNFQHLYPFYTVDTKFPAYLYDLSNYPGECRANSNILKYFEARGNYLNLQINKDITDGVYATIYPRPEGYSDRFRGRLNIVLQADMDSFSFSVDSSITTMDYVKMSAIVATVQVSSLEKALDIVDAVHTDFPSAFASSSCVINIHRTLYNQLSATYQTIVGYFRSINIYEN